jgi:tRNA(Leu) C34 or U34 (ribose-2'-O)-methylase TrmL
MNKTNVSLCLINPKSPQNMGSILRAAGCYGVNAIFYTGQRYARALNFATDTKNAGSDIPMSNIEDIKQHVPANTQLIAVELVEGAQALPHFVHPENAFYLFGPEDGSIPQEVLNQCEHIVYVPTKGCMNLAATVNVVLYDRMAKSPTTEYSDQIIFASRDTNNRTKTLKKE